MKITQLKLKTNTGSVLLEAIVALTAIMVTVVAIVTVVSISVSNSTFVKQQNTANKYAQEGMEQVRKFKEEDFNTFKELNGDFSLCSDFSFVPNGSCGVGNEDPATLENFDRVITFQNTGCNGASIDIQVIVTVSWASGKCAGGTTPKCHESKLVSCFSPPVNSQL